MKSKFPNIYEFLNRPYAYHQIDDVVYDTAQKLLDYFRDNKTFQIYNHSMNSDQDVQIMFDELVDRWIDEHYLNSSGECEHDMLYEYNVLTDRETNKVIKDEIFRIIRTSSFQLPVTSS